MVTGVGTVSLEDHDFHRSFTAFPSRLAGAVGAALVRDVIGFPGVGGDIPGLHPRP
ncbi:MAG: hypothetical protein M0031_13335 [Thermaerobacter sp.]|nr:hypothetical protein [Thermaerobacter sp.]